VSQLAFWGCRSAAEADTKQLIERCAVEAFACLDLRPQRLAKLHLASHGGGRLPHERLAPHFHDKQ